MRLTTLLAAPLFALAAAVSASATAAPAAQPVEVTMYVLPECGYCEKMRQHLTQAGVAWGERDISAPAVKAEFDAKGGIGTPLVVIGGDVIKGYMPQAVDASLRRQGVTLKTP